MAWIKSKYIGVRYRESISREYKSRPERYYVIRYPNAAGKKIEEPVGWESEQIETNYGKQNINEMVASEIRSFLTHNIRMGILPQSLAEKREMEKAEKIRIENEKTLADEAAKQEEKQNITFGEVAESFLKWGETNKKSWKDDYNRYHQRLEKPLAKLQVRDISNAYLDTLKASWMKKVSPKTVEHYLSLIHSIFEHAIHSHEINTENPVRKVKRPEYDNRKTRFFSHEQAAELLRHLNKPNTMTVHDQTIMGLYSGMRFSEISNLKWTDINFDTGLIEIRNTKTSLNRQAYITEPIEQMLKRRQASPKKDPVYVFRSRRGKDQRHVSSTFYRALKELGFNSDGLARIDRLDFHSTRHTFGSWLAQEGISLYEIGELMGHQDISQTKRYAKLLPETKRRAVESLVKSATSHNVLPLADRKAG